MKRYLYLIIFVLSIAIFSGCSLNNKKSDIDETKKIMHCDVKNISSIDVYSNGEKANITIDSDVFIKIMDIINENENKAKIIDGGMSMDMFEVGNGNYEKLSEKNSGDIYIINFSKCQNIKYSDYDSKGEKVSAIFVVPDENYFGTVIYDKDKQEIKGYATFMNLNMDLFENLK